MRRSGQTLVLILALMFLLTLMVCLTLSLGRMTKKKMELQVASDAAAYSEAVAVARTYNAVALLNREQAGKLVAALGVESAISFAGVYVAALIQAQGQLPIEVCAKPKLGCFQLAGGQWYPYYCQPAFNQLDEPYRAISAELGRINSKWRQLDTAAGIQARRLVVDARQIGLDQTNAMMSLRERTIRTGALATQIAEFANPDLVASLATAPVNLRELDLATTEEYYWNSVYAVAGSRVHPFIVNRSATAVINPNLRRVLAGTVAANSTASAIAGLSYYDGPQLNNSRATPFGAWGEDGATPPAWVTVDLAFQRAPHITCKSEAVQAAVKSSGNGSDTHTYASADPDPVPRHSFPGGNMIWPITWEVSPDAVVDLPDLFGQPKQLAALKVPLAPGGGAAADPWNLLVRFRFQPGDRGLDLKSLKLRGGEDVSSPQAVSTGLAYYHRSGHWREPPNLLNPFWRATLIHSDVDATGISDFRQTLVNGSPPHVSEAFDELRGAGFKAVP